MHRIILQPPEISKSDATYRWTVEPKIALYRKCQFTLHFPPSVDVTAVPQPIWWSIALICLHSHWPLLRPCTVHLPVCLPTGEKAVWRRLLEVESWTLDACRRRNFGRMEGAMEIVDEGPSLEPAAPCADPDRCATAFSGGKDSLLQVGLLTELTSQPVLVAVTSPMPPLEDHITSRRQEVLQAVVHRRDVTLVEVKSDYRAHWDNEFADRLGFPVGVNEITDVLLYFGALLAVGAAVGAPHLFVASEAEIQDNAEYDGRIVQHHHYMYSNVTQRVLQNLLKPWGFRYSSLTSPLHSYHIQELLWTRYADLRDLQYSCWSVRLGQAACSRCEKCLQAAMTAVALGDSPARMGIDLVGLFREMRRWKPQDLLTERWPPLPHEITDRRTDEQIVRSLRTTSLGRILRAMLRDNPRQFLGRNGWDAVRAFWTLRRTLADQVIEKRPGWYTGYLAQVDPLLRQRLGDIFAEHFPSEDEATYAGALARTDRWVNWVLDPLVGATSNHPNAA